MNRCALLLIFATGLPFTATTASPVAAQTTAPPVVIPPADYVPPRGYVCFRSPQPLTLDGRLDEPAWQSAPWTEDFGDIEGDRKPKPRFRTRAKMLWTDQGLYVGAQLDEPHVWGTITVRDSVIFHENDFEVFLDPDGDSHNYGEFELNAVNGAWDLRLNKPYKDGGKADDGWEIPGVQSAIHVQGTLNNPADLDEGWSIEILFPFNMLATLNDPAAPVREAQRDGSIFREYAAPLVPTANGWTPLDASLRAAYLLRQDAELKRLAQQSPLPRYIPRDGQHWRINFSRVEWQVEVVDGKYRRVPNKPEDNWVWSPQAKIDMHRPETWGYLQFSTTVAGSQEAAATTFRPDPTGPARHLLSRVYYAQQAYRQANQRYAESLEDLKLGDLAHPSLAAALRLETAADAFQAIAEVRVAADRTQQVIVHSDARMETK